MPEDKATLRSDLSADMEVSGKGDAVASLFFLTPTEHYPFWKPKSDKPDQHNQPTHFQWRIKQVSGMFKMTASRRKGGKNGPGTSYPGKSSAHRTHA